MVATRYRPEVLPFLPDQVGSIWNREAQIDVAGINFMEKTLILGECKWGQLPIDLDILRKLIEKTEKVLPADGQWKVFYLGFARSGWTEAAQQFAEGLKNTQVQGENWKMEGMLLRSLKQMDTELEEWTV